MEKLKGGDYKLIDYKKVCKMQSLILAKRAFRNRIPSLSALHGCVP